MFVSRKITLHYHTREKSEKESDNGAATKLHHRKSKRWIEGLSLHGKTRTLVFVYTRGFTGLIHPCVKFEPVNTAFTFGRIKFWAGHFLYTSALVYLKAYIRSSERSSLLKRLP
jgi:hypothetical protein